MWIVAVMFIGLVAGAFERKVVPGGEVVGAVGAEVFGLVGAVVGGLVGYLPYRDEAASTFQISGLLGGLVGCVLALTLARVFTDLHHRRTVAARHEHAA